MDLFFTFPQAYLQGKAAENSMLGLQPQEHEKAPLPVEKKMDVVSGRRNVVRWLRQETVSQTC